MSIGSWPAGEPNLMSKRLLFSTTKLCIACQANGELQSKSVEDKWLQSKTCIFSQNGYIYILVWDLLVLISVCCISSVFAILGKRFMPCHKLLHCPSEAINQFDTCGHLWDTPSSVGNDRGPRHSTIARAPDWLLVLTIDKLWNPAVFRWRRFESLLRVWENAADLWICVLDMYSEKSCLRHF